MSPPVITMLLHAAVALAVLGGAGGCSREATSTPAERSGEQPTEQSTQQPGQQPGQIATGFIGRDACIDCHQEQHGSFQNSHHDLAMQPATEATVLGDFDNASFEHFGVTSRFSTRDGAFFVETEGPDAQPHEYPVAYTFGVTPLQQYLVEFPGGRMQVLPLCWDSRPAGEGGQRWFHLYPDEPIPAGDELHWTGPNQNWNFMCAECHSTDLRKNYDLDTDTFETTWSEVDVSCEACHGPAAAHVSWAHLAGKGATAANAAEAQLTIDLGRRDSWPWAFVDGAPTATRTETRGSHAEVETCARCHARRATLTDDYQHARPLLDTHRLSLLTEPEYFADGQVRGENYVYGSFLQSKMHAAGVTCTDCHGPHSARLIVDGDALCYQCHQPAVFGHASHHRHPGGYGDPGTQCVDCHMPERFYMVVDGRRDHSFRVPRPDLTVAIGTPNACGDCHAEEGPEWAAAWIVEWFGENRRQEWHYAEALHAGREGLPGAGALLARLANDPAQPAIARATGLTLLPAYAAADLADTVRAALADPDPLVRLGALGAAVGLPPRQRLDLAGPLLADPVLGVRAEAVRVLAATINDNTPAATRRVFDGAAADFVASQLASAERPESHINLAVYYTDRGNLADAEREYTTALRLDPASTPASVNLADLRRMQGRDAEGEQILRDALKRTPRSAPARHALGLTRIRLDRRDEALVEFERAYEFGPDDPRHGFVLAIALDSLGMPDRALQVMRDTLTAHPFDREVLAALVEMCRARGLTDEAHGYAETLERLSR